MSFENYEDYQKFLITYNIDEYELKQNDALKHLHYLIIYKQYKKHIELSDHYLTNPLNYDIKTELLNNKAYALHKMKNNIEALKVFDLIDSRYKEIPFLIDTKANIYYGLGLYERALNIIVKMITNGVKESEDYCEFLGTKAKIVNKLGLHMGSIIVYCEGIYQYNLSPTINMIDFDSKYRHKIRKIGWKMSINYIFPKDFKQKIIVLLFSRKYSHLKKLPNELIMMIFENLGQLYIDNLIEKIISRNFAKQSIHHKK